MLEEATVVPRNYGWRTGSASFVAGVTRLLRERPLEATCYGMSGS